MQHPAIDVVQAQRIHLQQSQGVLRHCPGDHPVRADLSVVADAFEQAIGNARRPPRPPGDLGHTPFLNSDLQNPRRAPHNLLHSALLVESKAVDSAKSRPQRRRHECQARRRPHDREPRKL